MQDLYVVFLKKSLIIDIYNQYFLQKDSGQAKPA